MRTVDFYIDEARKKTGVKSDRQLGLSMGLSSGAITDFRTKRSWPADDTIRRLAELAGISPEQAVLELNAWRSTGETQKIYKRLIEKLNGVLSVLIIAFIALSLNAGSAFASTWNTKSLINSEDTLSHSEHTTGKNPEIYIITQLYTWITGVFYSRNQP